MIAINYFILSSSQKKKGKITKKKETNLKKEKTNGIYPKNINLTFYNS